MREEPGGVGETASIAATSAPRASGAHLFVVDQGSSTVVPLREASILTIGRAPDVELRLDHNGVSRRHARIIVEGGEVRITDLDSHNGTLVNGAPFRGSRALATGDVIGIGDAILIVHAELRSQLGHVILDETSWRRRLAEEVARAVQFQRSLAVLAIAGDDLPAASPLRTIDVLGKTDDGMLALLPEAEPHIARELAGVVIHALHAGVRVGVASCPSDVADADGLVMAARMAAAAARPGTIAGVADTVRRLELGERSVVVCHPATVKVYDLLRRLGTGELPVLILGENGVGKENAAYAVHHYSARRSGPFVALDCASIQEELVESQLFGHARGAFTGATSASRGYFEAAGGGTLFLDEIGELPLPVQAKLLRALETKRITRVGETDEREVDVRIVAATNRVLEDEIAAGRFRRDLYYRIGAARVSLLPLRERRCEIAILFRELVARATARANRGPLEPSPLALARLTAHPWPGNVRELRNVAEYVVATVEDDRIEPEDLPPDFGAAVPVRPADPPAGSPAPMRKLSDELEEIEQRRMREALERTGGVKTRAAALLGMPIRTFKAKFKQYGM